MMREFRKLFRNMTPLVVLLLVLGFAQRAAWAQEEDATDDTTTTVREVGDVIQVALPVTALAATIFTKDKEGAFQLFKSLF